VYSATISPAMSYWPSQSSDALRSAFPFSSSPPRGRRTTALHLTKSTWNRCRLETPTRFEIIVGTVVSFIRQGCPPMRQNTPSSTRAREQQFADSDATLNSSKHVASGLTSRKTPGHLHHGFPASQINAALRSEGTETGPATLDWLPYGSFTRSQNSTRGESSSWTARFS
jgi:hypothetical protein